MLMYTKYTLEISRLSLGSDFCSHKFLSNRGMHPFSLPWREGEYHPHPSPLPSKGEGITGFPVWIPPSQSEGHGNDMVCGCFRIPTFVGMTIEEHGDCESFIRRTTKQSLKEPFQRRVGSDVSGRFENRLLRLRMTTSVRAMLYAISKLS